MDTDGSHPRQVTRGGFAVEPVFSPDGQQIAFGRITGFDPNNFQQFEAVYVVRTDGFDFNGTVYDFQLTNTPNSKEDCEKMLAYVDDEQKYKIVRGNAIRMLELDRV